MPKRGCDAPRGRHSEGQRDPVRYPPVNSLRVALPSPTYPPRGPDTRTRPCEVNACVDPDATERGKPAMLALVEHDTEAWRSDEPAPVSPDDLLARVRTGDQPCLLRTLRRPVRPRARTRDPAPQGPGAVRGGHAGGLPGGLAAGHPVRPLPRDRRQLGAHHAHRRAVDRIRRRRRRTNRDTRIGIRDLEAGFDQVSESVEIRIEHERVSRALGKLTEFQRQAVQLAYYGGYSHSEIAERLGPDRHRQDPSPVTG